MDFSKGVGLSTFTVSFEFQCFESDNETSIQNYHTGSKYNYRVCPLGQITQSYELDDKLWIMDLGSWDGEMDFTIYQLPYLLMHYNNGSSKFCAVGNNTFYRSVEVYYFCASRNYISSVLESSECDYAIGFHVNCTVVNK